MAKNCNAPLDAKNGAEAKDWRAGKPVRVVRNCKGSKHSEYAPKEGNRYDGIYKVGNISNMFKKIDCLTLISWPLAKYIKVIFRP